MTVRTRLKQSIVIVLQKCVIVLIFCWISAVSALSNYEVNCSQLLMGQFSCSLPDIDPQTQQPRGCTRDNVAKVLCNTSEGIVCLYGTGVNGSENMFEKSIPCRYTNGYSFEITMLLSVFLGMFGLDRFYLGYHAIGVAKLCTLGFMFLGQLVDIILIALQVVGPADNSHYVIPYFGPVLTFLGVNNDTFLVPQDDW